MNKFLFLIFPLIFICTNNLNAQGHIREIINNTDEDIVIFFYMDGKGFNIVRSFLLDDNSEIQPVLQLDQKAFTLHARTRSTFNDLVIPNVSAGFCDSYLDDNKSHNIVMQFCGKRDGKFILRQKGDLMDFAVQNIKIMEMYLPNGKVLNAFEIERQRIRDEIIDNGTNYSIEIRVDGNWKVIIKRSDQPLDDYKQTKRPMACIKNFGIENLNSAVIQATIYFDQIMTYDFYKKFTNLVYNHEFLKRVSIMTPEVGAKNGIRLLKFSFFTRITQEEFQRILDQLNQLPL